MSLPSDAARSAAAGAGAASGMAGTVEGSVVGVGVDVVDPARLAHALARRPRLEERVFTPAECRRASGAARLARLSTRFAAKEAAWKALGVGLGGVGLRDVEVVGGGDAAPALALHGRAARLAAAAGVRRWHLSLSHTDRVAVALVLAEGATPGAPSPGADG